MSDGKLVTQQTIQAVVTNAAPTVGPMPGATLLVGETYSATATISDPGLGDPQHVVVYYGDPTPPLVADLPGSGSLQVTHTYATAATYTLRVTATDADGAVGSTEATIVVQSPQQAVATLAGMVGALASAATLSNGEADALQATLQALAQLAGTSGRQTPAAGNQLRAFLNQVSALVRSGRLTSDQAQPLVDLATRILARL